MSTKNLPPSFEHKSTICERESNLSEPDAQRAGDHVGLRVHDDRLQQEENAQFVYATKADARGVSVYIDQAENYVMSFAVSRLRFVFARSPITDH